MIPAPRFLEVPLADNARRESGSFHGEDASEKQACVPKSEDKGETAY
jgi:hypothetical protein